VAPTDRQIGPTSLTKAGAIQTRRFPLSGGPGHRGLGGLEGLASRSEAKFADLPSGRETS